MVSFCEKSADKKSRSGNNYRSAAAGVHTTNEGGRTHERRPSHCSWGVVECLCRGVDYRAGTHGGAVASGDGEDRPGPRPPFARTTARRRCPLAPGGRGVGGERGVVDPPVPVVAIRVRVPASATAGQELTYRIFVDNTAMATAHRVAVRLVADQRQNRPRDAGAGSKGTRTALDVRHDGRRAPKEITVVVVPDGSGEVRLLARVSFEHGQSVVTHLNQPELRLTKTGPAQAGLGDNLKYQLEVTNTGSADATEVVVTDELPEGLLFLQPRRPAREQAPALGTRRRSGRARPAHRLRSVSGETRRVDQQRRRHGAGQPATDGDAQRHHRRGEVVDCQNRTGAAARQSAGRFSTSR